MLKSVKFDVNVTEYVAGRKALGLISYLVTVPLWCIIENRNIHVLDGSVYYQEIIEYLESSVENLDGFITGTTVLSFVNKQALNTDKIFQALISPSDYDTKCPSYFASSLTGHLPNI